MTAILMYHQVADLPQNMDSRGLAMPPAKFEQQMSYLARNRYTCLTLAEAVQYFQCGRRTPARSFVLTFDDGYRDFQSVVDPILSKFGFTATIFLVAGRLGLLSNWWGQNGDHAGLLMSSAEARSLARRGHIFGSHTLSHPFLNRLDEQSACDEIQNSRKLLQEQLEMPIEFFSYPYSETNTHVEELVKSAGYRAACAGYLGTWSLFHIWRVPCLRDDTALSFALKASGFYDRRTALRESTVGRLARRTVHAIRHQRQS